MNYVVLCVYESMFFQSGIIKQMTGLWHCAHMASVHCLYGIKQCFGYLSTRNYGNEVVTLGTQGWSQAQLAAEFHTTQSNVSKLLKKTESLVK